MTRIPLHANMRQLPALICCDTVSTAHDPKGSELAAGPGSTNVTQNGSPSFDKRGYTPSPPHHRVVDITRGIAPGHA